MHQIDKDGANPERVMQELSSIGLMPEDWGGDIPMVQVIISCNISLMPDNFSFKEKKCNLSDHRYY